MVKYICFLFLYSIFNHNLEAEVVKKEFARKEIPGTKRLINGAQIDNNCIELGKKIGLSEKEVLEKFNSSTQRITQKIEEGCETKYPELKFYTNQWKKQFERLGLSCKGKGLVDEVDFSNFKLCLMPKKTPEIEEKCKKGSHILGICYLNEGQIKFGLEADADKYLVDFDKDKGSNVQGKPVIAIGGQIILEMLQGNHEGFDEVLAHELFHTTEANNVFNHNDVEVLGIDDKSFEGENKNICDINVTKDRITTITSLCLQKNVWGASNLKMPEALWLMQTQCGNNRACIDLFANNGPEIDAFRKDIPKKDAESVCQKFFFEGSCQYFMKTQKEYFKTFMSPVTKAAAPLLLAMEKILPSSPYELPKDFLKLASGDEANNFIKKIPDSKCFSKILNVNKDGSIKLKSELAMGKKKKSSLNKWEILKNSSLFYNLFNDYQKVKDDKDCSQEEKQLYLDRAIDISQLTDISFLGQALVPRSYGENEKSLNYSFDPASSTGVINFRLKKFLGEKKVDDYLKTLEERHPDSKKFNCTDTTMAYGSFYPNYMEFLNKTDDPLGMKCQYRPNP